MSRPARSDFRQCEICGDTFTVANPKVGCHRNDCPIPPRERAATRIITVGNPGYEVVLFFNRDGSAEALVSQPGQQKPPISVKIAAPDEGRRIVVERIGDTFEILYKDVLP